LTGRYYPGRAGRMIAQYTPGDPLAKDWSYLKRIYDPSKTPQVDPVFRPETKAKYQAPTPYGDCAPGGTPTSITTQATENGPFELIQLARGMYALTEFPLTARYIPIDGSLHPADPDVSFNGDSRGHWEGDTLVVDTIAIDTRMRNISVGKFGDANAWSHSDQEHVIERFTRASKNYLTYQVTVDDPVVLVKPFHSLPYTFSLAQRPDDVWTEYLCTGDEEPELFWKKADPQYKHAYETGQSPVTQ
jgi:hypothetical protein